MKKILFTSLLALVSLSLAGCGSESSTLPSSSSSSSSSVPQASESTPSSSLPAEESKFEIRPAATSEHYYVNQSVTLLAYLDDAPLLPAELAKVEFTSEQTNLVSINDNVVVFLAAGEATVNASYSLDGKVMTDEWKVTIEQGDTMTIAEAKKQAVGTTVTVAGKVTAVSGSSAYIADATGGIYVYNWSYNKDDTAIENKAWTLGQSVEVKANIAEFNGLIQLSNYDGGRIEGTYAYALSNDLPAMEPINLTEDGFKALQKTDAGNVYTFKATYVSGTPVKGTAVSTNWKLGSTDIVLRTDKYDPVEITATLTPNVEYTITTPLSWFNGAQFAFLGTGTTLLAQDGFTVGYEGTARVGNVLTLKATNNGTAVTDVAYSITKGTECGTLEGDKLTLVKAGEMTIHAVSGELTYDLNLTIQDELGYSTIAEVKAAGAADEVLVKGVVLARGYDGVLIGDKAGKENKMYAYFGTNDKTWQELQVNDYVSFEGATNERYGNVQLNVPTYEVLSETAPVIDEEPAKWTPENLTNWDGKIGDYVTLSGVDVTIDGTYTNFSYGSFEKGSAKLDSADKLEAGYYNLTGYMLDVNGGGYATLLVTGHEEAEKTVELSLDTSSAFMNLSDKKTLQLTATATGAEGIDKTVTWSVTEGEDVVSVSDEGLVTALKLGEATVTATSNEDSNVTASADITVTADGEMVSIVFDESFNTGFTTISGDEWTKTVEGIALSVKQAESTSEIALNDAKDALLYIDPVRIYKSQTFTLTPADGKKIADIYVDSDSSKKFDSSNVKASVEGELTLDRFVPTTAASEITFTGANQFRLYSINVLLQ